MKTDLFKEKYRIPTNRLREWNYGSDGFYFVTICEFAMREYFGNVKNGKMLLTPIGEVADKYWREITAHFPFVELDEFVVMPNHVHGILRLVGSRGDRNNVGVDGNDVVANRNVGVRHACSMRHATKSSNVFGPQSRNLASIVRGFKIGVTKYARDNQMNFRWQSRFYDHVIRDQKSLDNIRHYIRTNPERWHRDRNNFKNEFKHHD